MTAVDESLDQYSVSSSEDSNEILSSINDLSDELECIGLSLTKFQTTDDSEKVLSSLVAATWNLIQLHHSKIQEFHRPDELICRLTSDCKILREKISNLNQELAKKDRLLSISTETRRQLQVKYDKAMTDLKKEQTEVRRFKRLLDERVAKSNREQRRKEQEAVRTNSKIGQVSQPLSFQEITSENLLLRHTLLRLDKELKHLSTSFTALTKNNCSDISPETKSITDPIDFTLDEYNSSCKKHLDALNLVLEELSPETKG